MWSHYLDFMFIYYWNISGWYFVCFMSEISHILRQYGLQIRPLLEIKKKNFILAHFRHAFLIEKACNFFVLERNNCSNLYITSGFFLIAKMMKKSCKKILFPMKIFIAWGIGDGDEVTTSIKHFGSFLACITFCFFPR